MITEPVLEDRLIEVFKEMGARGFSVSEVRSDTARDFSGSNIRMEIIANRTIAEQMLERLHQDYFETYSMIAFLSEIEVIRASKFGSNT